MSLRVEVDDAEVVSKLGTVGPTAQRTVRAAIGKLVLRLQRNVVRDKLSGQVLNVRTGTLRRSIGQMVSDAGAKIVGLVSTNLKYAPPHEYGFRGTVNVQAHLREIKQAFGKRLKTPVVALVGPYNRTVNLPERSFLRSALQDMERSGMIKNELDAALAEALR